MRSKINYERVCQTSGYVLQESSKKLGDSSKSDVYKDEKRKYIKIEFKDLQL